MLLKGYPNCQDNSLYSFARKDLYILKTNWIHIRDVQITWILIFDKTWGKYQLLILIIFKKQMLHILEYPICQDISYSFQDKTFCFAIVNICKMCISLVFWFREFMRKTPAFEFSTFSIILQTVRIICLNNSSCSFQDTKLFQFSCTDSQHRDKHHTLIVDNYEKNRNKSVTTIISVRIGLR